MLKIFVAVFAVSFCLAQLSDQMTIYSDRDADEDNDWNKFKVNEYFHFPFALLVLKQGFLFFHQPIEWNP